MERRGLPEWQWKVRAIEQVKRELRGVLNPKDLTSNTFVPMPPSRAKGDPLYDDRLSRILSIVCAGRDWRELLVAVRSTTPAHATAERPRPTDIERLLAIDETVAEPTPSRIVLFDDVLTTGAHFKGAKSVLQHRFPGITVVGLFVARRRFAPEEWPDDAM